RESLTADCANPINQRRLADALIEALDTELARLLVETGIATEAEDGSLVYDPAASDTMVVVIGDNGSFGPTVKLPFDATRAKGSAYQDRKSTRLNSSHVKISYAVFCLKK